MIYLQTERLILRDYTMADCNAYFALKSHKDTMHYLQHLQLSTLESARNELQQLVDDAKDHNRKFYFLHMALKSSLRQVGSIGYTVTDQTPVGKMVGIGFFLYPEFWRQGYTTEAMKRIMTFAFTENDVCRIAAGCLAENIGSQRVLQGCGMIREGELIDSQWHDGKLKTRFIYRLLKQEWVATQNSRP